MNDEKLDFESALTELQQIVDGLERGEMNLDDALKRFERGIHLVRHCSKSLEAMELRVEQLMVTEDGEIVQSAFDAADEDE
ncbi:MAG: exodeoxyribonuclease VII small subunit [Candidatus Poribacteria bacterium]|nr:exodeoxyribonuclease VII small subunit [Candidatus Poribacteria bacterium]